MIYPLAIVIPAYKTRFLKEALTSLAAQTNKNFKVYVADDCSNEDIKPITDIFADTLNINYHRFPENLGHKDLAGHWNRSIKLTSEEWIWLFSDDDVMSPGCVEAFLDAIKATKGCYNLYRFNIEMIDARGDTILKAKQHPELESGYDFLKRRLQHQSLSAAIEYVFHIDTFKKNHGFISFPLAYCTDDASWMAFAGDKCIFTISKHIIYWRASGLNISSSKGLQDKKADALLKFIKHTLNTYPEKKAELLPLLQPWFFQSLKHIGGHLSLKQMAVTLLSLNNIFPGNKIHQLKQMLVTRSINTRFEKRLRFLAE